MKPRLRLMRGYWRCGMLDQHPIWWSCSPSFMEAFDLWKRSRP